jgi:hypothetical protein
LKIYREFATLYARGPYSEYSARIADILPSVLKRFEAYPVNLLDVACGEGTFAIRMAKRGFHDPTFGSPDNPITNPAHMRVLSFLARTESK